MLFIVQPEFIGDLKPEIGTPQSMLHMATERQAGRER